MKILLAQPAIPRFQWELEVLLTNIRQFTDMEVILLFTEHDFTVPMHFRKKYGCSVFTFIDRREDKNYIPSVRPFLLWQYFNQYPAAQQEQYLYIDSDIIFREWLDCATFDLDANKVYGANCDGYIGAPYIKSCKLGNDILIKMAEICNVPLDKMDEVPGIGAQIILNQPSAGFWQRVYQDSNALYSYLDSVDSNIQKWTAEMWAQLWGWVREGKTIETSGELAFCLPTDPIDRWDDVKILHNAGVTGPGDLFFKGQYVATSPLGQNFDNIRADKASKKYVEAIAKVVL